MVTAPAARRATATRHSSLERPGCAVDDMNLGTPPSVSWVIARLTYSRGGSGNAKRCFVTSSRVARWRAFDRDRDPIFGAHAFELGRAVIPLAFTSRKVCASVHIREPDLGPGRAGPTTSLCGGCRPDAVGRLAPAAGGGQVTLPRPLRPTPAEAAGWTTKTNGRMAGGLRNWEIGFGRREQLHK